MCGRTPAETVPCPAIRGPHCSPSRLSNRRMDSHPHPAQGPLHSFQVPARSRSDSDPAGGLCRHLWPPGSPGACLSVAGVGTPRPRSPWPCPNAGPPAHTCALRGASLTRPVQGSPLLSQDMPAGRPSPPGAVFPSGQGQDGHLVAKPIRAGNGPQSRVCHAEASGSHAQVGQGGSGAKAQGRPEQGLVTRAWASVGRRPAGPTQRGQGPQVSRSWG